jgi:deoxyadenosine/deoxycytidine kinase
MAAKVISIEGNIGSGKSTLLSHLKQSLSAENVPQIIFLQEPVDEWENIKDEAGNTMIQKFYGDQTKYSFSFQMMAYISRLALLKQSIEENPNAIVITERSLFTDKFVFAKMLYDSKKMESVEYQIYLRWFDNFVNDFPINCTIYVKTNPKVCHSRIAKRSRNGESTISLDYLNDCHKYHESMMQVHADKEHNILELNGNLEISDMKDTWVKTITEFITSQH